MEKHRRRLVRKFYLTLGSHESTGMDMEVEILWYMPATHCGSCGSYSIVHVCVDEDHTWGRNFYTPFSQLKSNAIFGGGTWGLKETEEHIRLRNVKDDRMADERSRNVVSGASQLCSADPCRPF